MPFATNGEVEIHFELLAEAGGEPVLLLAGAGRPSTDYDALFCDPLRQAGLVPIRIDLRDTGRSTGFAGVAARLSEVKAAAVAPPYSIADMADDVAAVMAVCRFDRAHIVGRSLGGLVAQQLAVAQPDQVASLSLIMAMSRSLADVTPDAVLERLERENIPDEDAYVQRQLAVAKANAEASDNDPDRIADEARIAWRHGIHPGGTARHFAAGLAVDDLRPSLAALTVPTLVIHGRNDRTIPLDRARETAAAIPGAILEIMDGMGHDGPPRLRSLWGRRVADFLS